jgi:hypothetical protein
LSAKEQEGFVLLGRRDESGLEVLAFHSGEGKVLCLFETPDLAEAFSNTSPEVRGQGWDTYMMGVERLPELVDQFDYVTLNPSPQMGAEKEIVDATGFARSLRSRSPE